MKKFFVCFAVLTAMVLLVSCGGAARLQCQNNSWEFAETCENGCDASTGNCNTKSSGNNENVDSDENVNTAICNENEYECSGTKDAMQKQ